MRLIEADEAKEKMLDMAAYSTHDGILPLSDVLHKIDECQTVDIGGRETEWIPVKERMPENAHHPGETCPRLLVLSKTFGPTEGWYNPDHHCWHGLIWRMTGERSIEHDIDMVRGDIPCVVKNLDVIAWKPYPEGKETE